MDEICPCYRIYAIDIKHLEKEMIIILAATALLFSSNAFADSRRVLMSDGSICMIHNGIVLSCDRERESSARAVRELPPTAAMIADEIERRSPERQHRIQSERDRWLAAAEDEFEEKQRQKTERAKNCVLPVGSANYVNLTGDPKTGCRWIGKHGEKGMGECPCEGDSDL